MNKTFTFGTSAKARRFLDACHAANFDAIWVDLTVVRVKRDVFTDADLNRLDNIQDESMQSRTINRRRLKAQS